MIISFNYPSQENKGGIKKLEFIPTYNVAAFPEIIDNAVVSPIIPAIGTGWLTGYFTPGTGVGESSEDLTVAGLVFDNTFKGSMPRVSFNTHLLFTEMSNSPFLVKYTDRNGVRLLYGTVESPMYFKFNHTSKSRLKHGSAYNFEFYSLDPKPGVYYNY